MKPILSSLFLIGFVFLELHSVCQVPSNSFIMAKEYSKEISIYKAKRFVTSEILGATGDPVQFEIDALSASTFGELTTLVYQSSAKNSEGLILCFYGNYWTESGVLFQGYSFKNLPIAKANEFLGKIEKCILENDPFINKNPNNNVYFTYDDLTVVLSVESTLRIRIFWNDFDADWENAAFKRTKRRLERKLN